MPNANIIELETCLEDCIDYCEAHPEATYAQLFEEHLRKIRRKWRESVRVSEKHHKRWREEQRQERVAWKQLSSVLRQVQTELRRVGAIDFPSERVLYWDEELLVEAVERMKAYLREHADAIDFAQESIDRFERIEGVASSEEREAEGALKDFQRFIDLRREAMGELNAIIREFRVALRRALGKRHPDYLAISWPYSIASDEGVLF